MADINPNSQQNPRVLTKDKHPQEESGATTVCLPRRGRGRPAGSKNKPKLPIIITRHNPNCLESHVLEIANGSDVIECINVYARRRGRGVCVLHGSGAVTNVALRQPAAPQNNVMTLYGQFQILSLTGIVLPPPAPQATSSVVVFLSGGQGQLIAGSVVGPLIAVGSVTLMAASFANAVFEILPLEEDESNIVIPSTVSQSSEVTNVGIGNGGGIGFYELGLNPRNIAVSDEYGWSEGGRGEHL